MQFKDLGAFKVDFVPRDPQRLLISVSSLGFVRKAQFQQFWGKIGATNASALFVAETSESWFNLANSEMVLAQIRDLADKYEHVAVIGDSMGASGALLMLRYIPKITRSLLFGPQFSIARPFISFDERYTKYSDAIENLYFDNFALPSPSDNCVMLYGNLPWQDYLHRMMFEERGFKTLTVENSPHAVAHYLNGLPGDPLKQLVDSLANFATPFTIQSAEQNLGEWIGKDPIRSRSITKDRYFYGNFGASIGPTTSDEISLERPATQSSVSKYSVGKSVEADASRANDGNVHQPYAFHTQYECEPWWSVNFERKCVIAEVRIFNRPGTYEVLSRASRFVLEVSDDAVTWSQIATKATLELFGHDGRPYIWRSKGVVIGQHLRLRSLDYSSLHLAAVRVFGKTA